MGSEDLSDLLIKQGNYDLRIHPIAFPEDIESVISDEEKEKYAKWIPSDAIGRKLECIVS